MAPDLKELLRDAAAHPSGRLDLDDVRRRAGGVRRERRMRAAVAGIAVVGLVVLATMPLLEAARRPTVDFADRLPGESRPDVSDPNQEGGGVPPPPWEALPAAPIVPRAHAASVWTGQEMVVWGGLDPAHEYRPLSDGAAYDPASRTWRTISKAPISLVSKTSAVWDGEQVVVWGFAADGPAAAGYDPATDRWRRLASPPPTAGLDATTVWTGAEMIVWGGHDRDGVESNTGVVYDPSEDRWRHIDAAPIEGRFRAGGVWTGDEFIVWGGAAGDGAVGRHFGDGAAYDPERKRWRRIAAAPLRPREPGAVLWSGNEVLVLGGSTGDNGIPSRRVAAYDPDDDRWRRLDPIGLAGITDFAWAGTQVIAWGPQSETPVAISPRSGTGSVMGKTPGQLGTAAAAVWTGRQTLIWGGYDSNGAPVDSGGAFNGAAYPMADDLAPPPEAAPPPPDPVDEADEQAEDARPGAPDDAGAQPLWPPVDDARRFDDAEDAARAFGLEVLGWKDGEWEDREPLEDGSKGVQGWLTDGADHRVSVSVVPTKGLNAVNPRGWAVTWVGMPHRKTALSVGIDEGEANVVFKWPLPEAKEAELILRYGADENAATLNRPDDHFFLNLPFSIDRHGSLLILFRDAANNVVGAQGTRLPPGEFAAG